MLTLINGQLVYLIFLEKETQIKYQLSAILGRLSIIMNFMKQLLVVLNQDRVSKLLDLGYNLKSKKKINPTPVGEFINRNNLKCKRIDFLKIDIEGMDFKIIKAIPINNLDIDLIMIEKGSKAESKQLLSFLRGKEFNVFFENERNFIFKKSQTNSMDG